MDKFEALKTALKELNYESELPSRDCVPLVEAIFSDLIEVTTKYQSVKQASTANEKEMSELRYLVEAQRSELAAKQTNMAAMLQLQTADASAFGGRLPLASDSMSASFAAQMQAETAAAESLNNTDTQAAATQSLAERHLQSQVTALEKELKRREDTHKAETARVRLLADDSKKRVSAKTQALKEARNELKLLKSQSGAVLSGATKDAQLKRANSALANLQRRHKALEKAKQSVDDELGRLKKSERQLSEVTVATLKNELLAKENAMRELQFAMEKEKARASDLRAAKSELTVSGEQKSAKVKQLLKDKNASERSVCEMRGELVALRKELKAAKSSGDEGSQRLAATRSELQLATKQCDTLREMYQCLLQEKESMSARLKAEGEEKRRLQAIYEGEVSQKAEFQMEMKEWSTQKLQFERGRNELLTLVKRLKEESQTMRLKWAEANSQLEHLRVECAALRRHKDKAEESRERAADKVSRSEEMLRRLTRDRDALIEQCDDCAETAHSLRNAVSRSQLEADSMKQLVFEAQTAVSKAHAEAAELKRAVEASESQRVQLQQTLTHKKNECVLLNESLSNLNNDLKMIEAENEYLQREVGHMSTIGEEKAEEMKLLLAKVMQLENGSEVLRTEKEEVLAAYRTVCASHSAASDALLVFEERSGKQSVEADTMRQQVSARQRECDSLRAKAAEQMRAIQALERSKGALTRELQRCKERVHEYKCKVQSLRNDVDCARRINATTTVADSVRTKASAMAEAKCGALSARVRQLQTEKQLALDKLQAADQNMAKLQSMLQTVRKHQLSASPQPFFETEL